jgi:hypothetical protein
MQSRRRLRLSRVDIWASYNTAFIKFNGREFCLEIFSAHYNYHVVCMYSISVERERLISIPVNTYNCIDHQCKLHDVRRFSEKSVKRTTSYPVCNKKAMRARWNSPMMSSHKSHANSRLTIHCEQILGSRWAQININAHDNVIFNTKKICSFEVVHPYYTAYSMPYYHGVWRTRPSWIA